MIKIHRRWPLFCLWTQNFSENHALQMFQWDGTTFTMRTNEPFDFDETSTVQVKTNMYAFKE